MTFRPETESSEDGGGDGERVCSELQAQLEHARALMDQSRRLLTAVASEPRSFRRRDDD
jgi:hypothetical protein